MGKYEQIAFEVLELAFGDRWVRDDSRIFSFGSDAGTGEVSGTLDGQIAVQVAAGSQKQIRGDLLDLMFHPLPLKLMVLVDSQQHSAATSVWQAAVVMASSGLHGAVVRLAVTPSGPLVDVDLLAVKEFVEEWTGGHGDGVRMLDVRETSGGCGSVLMSEVVMWSGCRDLGQDGVFVGGVRVWPRGGRDDGWGGKSVGDVSGVGSSSSRPSRVLSG